MPNSLDELRELAEADLFPCSCCHRSLPKEAFNKGPRKCGLDGRCKGCKKERYNRDKCKILKRKTEDYHNGGKERVNERRSTVRNYLNRLRSMNIKDRKGKVTLARVLRLWKDQQGLCALTGKKMTHTAGQGRIGTNVSIDRIDNTVGYEEANLQLVCQRANLMRGDLTVNEFKTWCMEVLEHG